MITRRPRCSGHAPHRHDSERGATAVEYGLMVALIAVAALFMISEFGTNMADMFEMIAGLLDV